jgi:hypothetical protein
VITMQEAILTVYAMMMQKEMHNIMRRIPCFQYMGQPIDHESWAKHFSRRLGPLEMYLSGDYEGATNNIDSEVSLYAWDSICRAMLLPDGSSLFGTVWHEAGRIDLVHHMFDFSKFGAGFREQTWGQLMGSPTSFPILCLINAAASSVGLGLTVDQLLSEETELVVNGDDIAAICSHESYTRWVDAVGTVGLKLSLGKNYTSKLFLIMNSECRTPYEVDGIVRWDRVGFINQALLTGYEKKGIYAGEDLKPSMTWRDLGARARELVEDLPDKVVHRVMDRFVYNHRDILSTVPPGISRNVNESLGGVGLPVDPMDTRGVPLGNLQTASLMACEDLKKRAYILKRPSSVVKGLLDKFLADSERYYMEIFPCREQDRDPWDVQMESWGIPLPREKSDIGSSLRVAYVLQAFLAWYRTLSPKQIRAFGQDSFAKKRAGLPEIGSSVDLEQMRRGLVSMNHRLKRMARMASRLVPSWNHSDRLPGPDVPFGPPTKDQVFLIRETTAIHWRCPQELVVDYKSVDVSAVYQGQANGVSQWKTIPLNSNLRRHVKFQSSLSQNIGWPKFVCDMTHKFLSDHVVDHHGERCLRVQYRDEGWDPQHGLEALGASLPLPAPLSIPPLVDFYSELGW